MSDENSPEREPLVCIDCGAIEDDHQREYNLDCRCGGMFVEAPKADLSGLLAGPGEAVAENLNPLAISPAQLSDAAYRRAREILVADASRRGRPQPHTARDNRLPEEISPWSGLDPALAQEMSELFPAPNPDIVASRRLRQIAGWGGVGKDRRPKSIGVVIPQEILFVTGMRKGDLVLVSGWAAGIIRLVRVSEGPD